VASFFVSHSSEDAAEAAALCARLESAGYPPPFVSSEADHTIAGGRRWERELYRHLQARDAVIFVTTAASVESRWCFAELALARMFGKRIFPVRAGAGTRSHPLLEDIQAIALSPDREAGYRRLLRDLDGAGLAPEDVDAWEGGDNPYPGLRSYGVDEAAVFFGRAREVADLERRLRLRPASPAEAFLTVIGSSGSGKSSLVRAGLLPKLHRARTEWLVVDPLVPGARPVDGLARALTSTAKRDGLDWAWREVSVAPLADRLWDLVLARGLAEADAKVLLFIDQLEELLRVDAGERERFVEAIASMLRGDVPLRVVATLRSGSVALALEEPSLVALLQNQMVVARLERSRLRDVIEGPARVASIALAAGLSDRILDEAVGADALPLLAFTLRRLVQGATEPGSVTLEDYERTGGVIRALESTADEVLAGVEERFGRERVAAALMSLVTLDSAGAPMRRRVTLAGLDDADREILERFVEARLLTSSAEGDEAVVEVAHEALFRVWRPLQLLIAEHRSEIEMRAQLLRSADDWERAERRASYVLRGDRLAAAQVWLERHDGSSALRAFVDASVREDAGAREREADLLANRVLSEHRDDPERAVLLALAAIDTYARTPRTLLALSTALEGWRVEQVLPTGDWVHVAAPSPDGALVAALTSARVLLFDLATGEPHATFELPPLPGVMASNQALTWTPDGRFVIAGQPGAVTVWDVAQRRLERTLDVGDAQACEVAVSKDGTMLACAANDGYVSLWRLDALDAPAVRFQAHQYAAQCLAFSTDGRRLLTGGSEHRAVMWQLDPPAQLWRMEHGDSVWAVDWAPIGATIATVAPEDGAIRLWDAEHHAEGPSLSTGGWSYGLRFGPHGQIATTSRGLLIWDEGMRAGEPRRLKGRAVGRNPRFTADGRRIVLDHEREGVWIWDARAPGPELSLEYQPRAACFCGRYVVVRERETIGVYDAGDGRAVAAWAAPEEMFPRLDATPDGRLVASDHSDGPRLWRVPDGALVRHFSGNRWPRFSADGRLLLLYGDEGGCEVWAVDPLERLHAFSLAGASVWSADLVLDGRQVVTAGMSRVSVWDVADGALVRELPGSFGGDVNVAAAPDGWRVAVSSSNGDPDVGIWDARTGALIRPLAWGRFNTASAYAPTPASVVFSPGGERLATASHDGSVQVWDAAGGQLIQLLTVADSLARSARFSPDGRLLVTTEDEGSAKVWPALAADDLVARARDRAFRPLTADERAEYGLSPSAHGNSVG
jgi:WD40 repeat protein